MIGLKIVYIKAAGSIRRYRSATKTQRYHAKPTSHDDDQPSTDIMTVRCGGGRWNAKSHLTVIIEKLAGVWSGSACWRCFGIVSGSSADYMASSRITSNGNEFVLTLEDVGSDRTWRRRWKKYNNRPVLRLQKKIRLSSAGSPHPIYYGSSGRSIAWYQFV